MSKSSRGIPWGKYAAMALVIGIAVGIVAPLVAQAYNWAKSKVAQPKA